MRSRWLIVGASFLLLTILSILTTLRFFSGSFGNMHESNRPGQPATPPHREDWASYLSTINSDKVGSIVVDLGLKDIAPIANRTSRLRVDVQMNYPGENGLPQQQEFERLNEIDEKISTDLASKIGAVYAGHLYFGGTVSLYYYMGENASFESALSDAMSSFPEYGHTSTIAHEENWESYQELLYPLPIQLQSIYNHKVVAHLQSQGDDLSTKRPVRHLIYFKNNVDLEHFLSAIRGKGFEVTGKESVSEGDYIILLIIERNDSVDSKSVDSYVLDLWQKASDANGDYDGWGSSLRK